MDRNFFKQLTRGVSFNKKKFSEDINYFQVGRISKKKKKKKKKKIEKIEN